MDKQIEEIMNLLDKCTHKQREVIFNELRKEFKIHSIEDKLNTQAEIILEAINKDDSGLTFRMMRGVIAEAAFEIEVLSKLKEWKNVTPDGDLPYDYLLTDGKVEVSIQVKLQRSLAGEPMMANQAYRRFSPGLFVVETQKTRGGVDAATKESTRPYRFGEFNILAVSMHPSTLLWSSFMYTVSDWLIPEEEGKSRILKFQPVSSAVNDDWTDNFEICIDWLRRKEKKTIKF